MQTTYDRQARRLRLAFDSADERASYIEVARRESGFLVTLPAALGLHETVAVELSVPEDSSTVEARVAQVFDKGFGKFGTAFLVDDWTAAAVDPPEESRPTEAPDRRDPGPPQPDASAPDGIGPEGPDTASAAAGDEDLEELIDPNEGEMRGTSPIHVIKQMNPRQRALLAIKATRTQRHILLRDHSPQVLQNLLANPQIDSEEVLQIARSSHVVAPLLQRIANDARWGSNQEILAIIARHPKTPSIFATRLMPNLRTPDLRMMAKMSGGLREITRKAALREYLRRTGQRF